jgi:hypothetical protein
MFNEVRECPACQSVYLSGTSHNCLVLGKEQARRKLENWLGKWTVEGDNSDAV